MDTGKISNKRLIYAATSFATEDQIYQAITKAFTKANIIADCYINVLLNKGKMCKCAYVWVTSDQAFDFLIGIEHGIAHVKRVTPVSNPNYGKLKLKTSSNSWADDDDDNGVDDCKTINVLRDIDIPLDKVEYTEEQIKNIKTEIPTYNTEPFYIKFSRATVEDIRPKSMLGKSTTDESESESSEDDSVDRKIHNVWIAKNIPQFVNFQMILDKLKRFVSDTNARGTFRIGDKEKYVTYPHVNIKKNYDNTRRVYITFNPDSTDGIFALYMCRQVKLDHNGQKGILYFDHFIKHAE